MPAATPPAEPRFFRIAAAMADATRARMLALLLGGQHRSAGEIARAVGVTAQAASTQLARLVDSGLVSVRPQGRHKYFALADAEVAHALEALSLVAEREDGVAARWQRPRLQPLKYARRCYGHLAGELGVAQYRMLLRAGHLVSDPQQPDAGLRLSASGNAWLGELGITPPTGQARRMAYPCMDWSERQDHAAGTLAVALLDHYLERGWLRADAQSRALSLTPTGRRELLPRLAVDA